MKRLGVTALILCLQSTTASAAVPEFGTKEGELACAALTGLALAGASASQAAVPQVVNAMALASGFYLGRLSKLDPDATRQDTERAMAKLTLEEKNTYVNLCLKKAGELMAPTLK